MKDIAFLMPAGEKFMALDDCCWGFLDGAVLPGLILSMASQLDGVKYADLRIDVNTVISSDIVVYPIAWPLGAQKIYDEMRKLCSGKHIVVSIPPGYAEDIAMMDGVFAVVFSEPETVISEIDKYDTIEEWRNSVDGICYKDGGRIVKKGFIPSSIHKIRPMNYDIVPDYYWDEFRYASYQVARGCPYRCRFCVWGGSTVTDRTYKTKSPDRVFLDLSEIMARRRNAFMIFLICAQLTTDINWIKSYRNLSGGSIPYHSNINLFEITNDKMKMLLESGMQYASCGLEAATDRLLNMLGKKHTFDDAVRGLSVLSDSQVKHMIHIRTGFGETVDDVDESIRNFKTLRDMGLNINIHSFAPIEYYKGTDIYGDIGDVGMFIKHPDRDSCILKNDDQVLKKWHELYLLLLSWGWVRRYDVG